MSSFFIFRFQQKMGTEASSGDDVMKKPQPVSDPAPGVRTVAVGICFLTSLLTMSDDARDITRFLTYRWAACLVNDEVRFCVFLAVSFASGICADLAYALLTFCGMLWSKTSSQICRTKWVLMVLVPIALWRGETSATHCISHCTAKCDLATCDFDMQDFHPLVPLKERGHNQYSVCYVVGIPEHF